MLSHWELGLAILILKTTPSRIFKGFVLFGISVKIRPDLSLLCSGANPKMDLGFCTGVWSFAHSSSYEIGYSLCCILRQTLVFLHNQLGWWFVCATILSTKNQQFLLILCKGGSSDNCWTSIKREIKLPFMWPNQMFQTGLTIPGLVSTDMMIITLVQYYWYIVPDTALQLVAFDI